MAEFCQQCSIDTFGGDFRDLANLGRNNPPLEEGKGYVALCEGCGPTLVDDNGKCLCHDHDGQAVYVDSVRDRLDIEDGEES